MKLRVYLNKKNSILLITVTAGLPWVTPFLFLRVANHSAVRVFTGEADEIATQSPCGFCGEIFNKP
jgi:hypothetical protein